MIPICITPKCIEAQKAKHDKEVVAINRANLLKFPSAKLRKPGKRLDVEA